MITLCSITLGHKKDKEQKERKEERKKERKKET